MPARNTLMRPVVFHWPAVVMTVCGLFGCLATLTVTVRAQDQPGEHPLLPAIRLAQQSLQALQSVKDYEATFTKREWVSQQFVSQRMTLKFREQPFSVYMKFGEPNAGREILFVAGQNQNQLLAREASGLASLVGTVSLPLNDSKVTAENRHPITEMGMRRLVELMIERWQNEAQYGEIEVNFYPNAKMGNVACEAIEVSHPTPRKQFPFHVTRLYLDKATRYPVRVENFGFPRNSNEPPPLIEEYTYTDVRVNLGFTDADFDRRNRNYSF